MFNKFIPYAYANDIFEINVSFFAQKKVKVVLVDLDNTLDSYRLFAPSERVLTLKENFAQQGIEMIIISNNKGPRVREYASSLGVKFLSSAHKPFKKRILAYLKQNNLSPDDVMLVGDQLLTDVLCGYRAKIRVVLTEPVVKEDQWTTRFNRMVDRPIRRRLKKKNRLTKWVNLNGKL